MRLYEATTDEFRGHVLENKIADIIGDNFYAYYKREVGKREYNSWANSLRLVKDALDIAELKDNYIVVEYELPYSSKRIDVLLFGRDNKDEDNIVLVELKQWSNENVYDCETEGNVLVNYGTFKKECAHPSLQVEGYHYGLRDNISAFEDKPPVALNSCSYCHNYKNDEGATLFLPKFSKCVATFPVFTKEETKKLGEYLSAKLSNHNGLEVFNRFVTSPIRPSRRLLDHTKQMIHDQQIFNLIDDQIAAYNSIMHKAKKLAKSKNKSVIIIKGGPGTGKSVIALEVMGELMRKGIPVFHATGSSAFTNTLRKIVGTRSAQLFKFFNSFQSYKDNSIPVLVCDEAHRIRETSNSRYTPRAQRSNLPQIEELLKATKLSIFFIDEHQVVRPNEIGSVDLIKKYAEKLKIGAENISEFELKTQFRCSGSDSYLKWLDHVLQIGSTEGIELPEKDDRFDFKVVDSPTDLKKMIDSKNKEKENSARIVAGFCWPWSNPRSDGSLVDDVVIGDFSMPWEQKNQFWKWATDKSGMDQVGTVYTAQGFEFDYIGVIFGNDLVYNQSLKKWEAKPENSSDTMVARNNDELVTHLKNVYRVLMSRAHLGCYVYFMDKETEKLFKECLQDEK